MQFSIRELVSAVHSPWALNLSRVTVSTFHPAVFSNPTACWSCSTPTFSGVPHHFHFLPFSFLVLKAVGFEQSVQSKDKIKSLQVCVCVSLQGFALTFGTWFNCSTQERKHSKQYKYLGHYQDLTSTFPTCVYTVNLLMIGLETSRLHMSEYSCTKNIKVSTGCIIQTMLYARQYCTSALSQNPTHPWRGCERLHETGIVASDVYLNVHLPLQFTTSFKLSSGTGRAFGGPTKTSLTSDAIFTLRQSGGNKRCNKFVLRSYIDTLQQNIAQDFKMLQSGTGLGTTCRSIEFSTSWGHPGQVSNQ